MILNCIFFRHFIMWAFMRIRKKGLSLPYHAKIGRNSSVFVVCTLVASSEGWLSVSAQIRHRPHHLLRQKILWRREEKKQSKKFKIVIKKRKKIFFLFGILINIKMENGSCWNWELIIESYLKDDE